jgi:Zn-dependent protease
MTGRDSSERRAGGWLSFGYGTAMARGLRFRLVGIPVRVDLTFFVVVALLGWGGAGADAALVVWIVVAFVSILWHELGHAVMFRTFGVRSEIVLHGMGGHTVPVEGSSLTRGRSILVSLAGPGAGLLLGIAAITAQRVLPLELVRSPYVWLALVYLGLINIWWSILNLAPLLPLDGGQTVASLLDVVTRGRGRTVALALSVATAGAGAMYGLLRGSTWIAFLAVLFGAMNLAELVRRRTDDRERARADLVLEGFRRLSNGDRERAAALAREVLDGPRAPRARARAGRLLMWSHLLSGEAEEAEAALATAEPGSVPVLGPEEVAEAVGGSERGLEILRHGLAATGGSGLRSELTRALIERGRVDEALRLVTESAPEEVASPARVAVALALHEEERYQEAARLFGEEFARRPSPALAYDAACGWARAGRHQDALIWLGRAVEAGYSDRRHLDADPDLDAIREVPAFQELRRRIPS